MKPVGPRAQHPAGQQGALQDNQLLSELSPPSLLLLQSSSSSFITTPHRPRPDVGDVNVERHTPIKTVMNVRLTEGTRTRRRGDGGEETRRRRRGRADEEGEEEEEEEEEARADLAG
ncbi:hypothetical protein EYF80_065569 [Liparis tanakae]|uniref:Uncharacterized protein n=1 Tax=Liparis tanakae TaxID=230148 RepID=A0A4Z2E688_9TELE|nr:hypothetical protein EYF80_065569 [Liparis tanakae]